MANPTLIAFIAANAAKSDAEVLALWSADVTTARPIELDTLESFLNKHGLLVKLQELVTSAALPAEDLVSLVSFLKHLESTRQKALDTTVPEIAQQSIELLAKLQQAKQMTADQAAAILAMGGGLRHPSIVLQDVTDARTAGIAQAAAVAAQTDLDRDYRVGTTEIRRRAAAGETALSSEELRAFVAAEREGE